MNAPGGKIQGCAEGKVKEALNNHMKGRRNAKTIEYWPFTLKSFVAWFLNQILVFTLGTLRQHSITWIGRARTGKSLGSKTIMFAQSKYEIDLAERDDLVPSIITAKNLELISKQSRLQSINQAAMTMPTSSRHS